jgi:hypothetical protein
MNAPTMSRAALKGALEALEAVAALDDNFLRNGLDYSAVGRAIGRSQAVLMFFKPEAEAVLREGEGKQ